ncbi:glycoside hydrolase [Diplogelasinospora grovesii]|uniref:xylan 1,4-beta-xylosidase n=1 Tax=Diplogelasinospora grovesii TaxID=303347 RepID=A0AAN6S272_9PEZI|nr:glycoside hydrolase [Diplogelasinospora grovesii]
MSNIAPVGLLLLAYALGGAEAGARYPDCSNGPLKSNVVCDTSAAPEAPRQVSNSPGFSKLGLSAYQWWNEALHGVAHNRGITWANSGSFSAATQFPQAITSGAAFDDGLVEQMATVIGTEARAFVNAGRAHLDFWTPNINPFRDPRWGRGHETPGEDALRNKKFGEAFVRGMQGNDPKTRRVIATCKHFAAYDLERGGSATRFNFDAKVSIQDLAEYYLPPFQGCARDAKARSVMCSYNAVNGVPACANSYYLMDTTTDNQYVVSDCDAVYYLGNANGGHRYKSSYAAAVGAALEAGCDNMCWATDGTAPDAAAAFNQKQFSQDALDRAMVRQYQGLVKAGYFDGLNGMYRNLGAADVSYLALRVAQAGTVLLKNDDNTLPLTNLADGSNSVAMIGFWANAADKMLGGYSGSPPFNHDPVTAAKAMGIKANYASGPLNSGVDTSAAVSAAHKSDKESSDRSSIAWPAAQLSVIQKLAGLGKPVVVVKLGTHVDDTPLLSLPNVKAILWAGYPGQDGGIAVMNIITGIAAPAARLPMTMYPSGYTNQAPITNMALRPSGPYLGRTYKWYKDAVFPFGHGLHYTNFSISTQFPETFSIQDLVGSCKEMHLDLCAFESLNVTVTNTGPRPSDYVVLGFMSGDISNVIAGQAQAASLNWNLRSLARVDGSGNQILYLGTYTLLLGRPTVASVAFTLTGTEAVLDKWPQPN